jgi:anti-anti-sigma regulatory factor
MPHDIRIISHKDFLRSDVHGRLDLDAMKRVLGAIAAECVQHPGHHVLIDLRGVERADLGVRELYALVSHLGELGGSNPVGDASL